MTTQEDNSLTGIIAVLVLVLVPILYVLTGQFAGNVNNEPLPESQGTGQIAQMLSKMIVREVDAGFCPSSYIWPGHIRFDVCGFQEGEQQIWQRVVMQLTDHLTREGPASDRDADLSTVLANINRPNTWSLIFASNNTISLLRDSAKHLDAYSDRLHQDKAGYYPRIDNLSSLLSDLTSVLGGESKKLAETAANDGLYSLDAREAYFHGLGTLAASCWTMQAARADFVQVLQLQSALSIYDQAQGKLCEKIGKKPTFVINANDLSHLLTLSGSTASAVNDLVSLQQALASASRNTH